MFYQLLNPTSYAYAILVPIISVKLLLFSHFGTMIVAVLFGFFLWKTTKKLSSFYLFLISLCFGIWCLGSFTSWVGDPRSIMFAWSILDIFSMSFFFLSYWFLYSFVKKEDLPLWQKVTTLSVLIPTLYITVMNIQLDTYDTVVHAAWENDAVVRYDYLVGFLFIIITGIFTFTEYRKTTDTTEKRRIALAGLGVFSFLFMFNFWGAVSFLAGYFNLFESAVNGDYYIFEVYGLFGMPILLAFLGYLIMKYQAFDLKPIKSVMLVIVLMLILFVSTFV